MAYCRDTKRLVPDLQSFRPTFLLSVPRVFEKVYNTAKQQAGGSPVTARIFALAESTAVAWSTATTDQGGRHRHSSRPDTPSSTGWCTPSCAPRSGGNMR